MATWWQSTPISFTAEAGQGDHRARSERRRQDLDDRGLRGLSARHRGHGSRARVRSGDTATSAQRAHGRDAAGGWRVSQRSGVGDRAALRGAVRQRRRCCRAGRGSRADQPRARRRGGGCRGARSNACRWRLHSPRNPMSPSSTNRHRASTSTVATRSAASSAIWRPTDAPWCWRPTSSTRRSGWPTAW